MISKQPVKLVPVTRESGRLTRRRLQPKAQARTAGRTTSAAAAGNCDATVNYTVELQCQASGTGAQREGGTAMTQPQAGHDDGDASGKPDGRITREVVLAAALELIDQDGVDGLSMRRLARVLHRDPMIVYRHAPNKAALLDGVAETVLAQLKVDPADPDWTAQLRDVARGYRALALAHPNVVPLLVTRPLATPLGLRPPGTLRPLEDILTLLTRAGFSGPDALHIYRALFGFLHGHVLNELQELIENPDETDDLLRLGLHRLPIREFPLLRSLAPALASYDGATELERGLDILLTGLTNSLTPLGATQAGAGPQE
jgi:AcrR family transcriptional regulator